MTKTEVINRIRQQERKCRRCNLIKEVATQVVPSIGPARAKIFIIGRNPGKDEDRQGVPFVGPGGRLLNKILDGIQVAREACFISNLVKCHTPYDREPTNQEVGACISWLVLEIATVQPRLIVALGNQVVRQLGGQDFPSVTTVEGQLWYHEGFGCNVFLLPHPGFFLRKPKQREDLFNITVPKLKRIIDRLKLR